MIIILIPHSPHSDGFSSQAQQILALNSDFLTSNFEDWTFLTSSFWTFLKCQSHKRSWAALTHQLDGVRFHRPQLADFLPQNADGLLREMMEHDGHDGICPYVKKEKNDPGKVGLSGKTPKTCGHMNMWMCLDESHHPVCVRSQHAPRLRFLSRPSKPQASNS